MGKIILTDKRGRPVSYQSLYEGGRPAFAPRRSTIPPIYTRDAKDEVGAYTWRQLLSSARYLYANVGAVRGAINEIGCYAVGDAWLPRYVGRNAAWGENAEAWLVNWFKICDLRGAPFDFRTNLFLTSVSIDRCGDNALILTEAESGTGYPMVQFLPAHRIGGRMPQGIMQAGPYKGLPASNGVIFNAQGRAVALQIVGDDEKSDAFISTRDCQLNFNPSWFDQGRGITALAHAIKDFSDYRDIRDFLKLGIKASSSVALIENNETGSADLDAGAEHFTEPNRNLDPNGVTMEELDGGSVRYFRANSGAGLTTLKSERPSEQEQTFIEGQILRGAYAGLEWPLEMSWNPERLGGANVRLIVAKAERTVINRQCTLGKTFIRAVTYGIAKAIKIGILPFDDDWAAWDAQLPSMLTVDAGYSSRAEVEEYKAGFTTLSDVYGKRGYDWQGKIRQRVKERRFLLDECAKEGVNPAEIQLLDAGKPAEDSTSTDTKD